MFRSISLVAVFSLVAGAANAQNMILKTSSSDYVKTPIFNNVVTFDIEIEIAEDLAPGV